MEIAIVPIDMCIKSTNSITKLGHQLVVTLEEIDEVKSEENKATLRFLSNIDNAENKKSELRSALTILVISYESYRKRIAKCNKAFFGCSHNKKKGLYGKATELALLVYTLNKALDENGIAGNYLNEAEELGEKFFAEWDEVHSQFIGYQMGGHYTPSPYSYEEIQSEKRKFEDLVKDCRRG